MSKKLTHEYVYNYYNNKKYFMKSIYKHSKYKDSLTCPIGHNIEITFAAFQKGNRCKICYLNNRTLFQEYINNYYASEKYILNSIYIGNQYKDKLICPVGHEIEMTFNTFQQGHRCAKCAGLEKHCHKYVFDYYASENYTMKSIYIGNKNKDKLTCPIGHDIEMKFNTFQRGSRCNICYRENNRGKNHPKFNPNREEIPLNSRLRKPKSKDWVIKNMKDDPRYQDFLLNSNNYVVDHIIPISLFCELFTKYSLDEGQVKNIINQRDNLQLLLTKDNRNKWDRGSSLFEATQYLINNGVEFETFLEEK